MVFIGGMHARSRWACYDRTSFLFHVAEWRSKTFVKIPVNCQVVRNAQAAGIPCAGALRRVEVCSQHFCPGADLNELAQ